MGTGIFLLKHLPLSVNSIWHIWPQNIVSITLSRQISLDAHYVCSAVVGYCCQHHDTSTAKSVNFLYPGRAEIEKKM
jgi:hypothetical protein